MTATGNRRYLVRFSRFDRALHLGLMVSFLGLALTGLPLLFSDARWAATLARLFGGFQAAGILHRLCATLMLAVFGAHLGSLFLRLVVRRERGLLWGQGSMIPQPRDVVELYRHLRWFVGLGPRPPFGRYTYWEKFDYWAVFWGMGIIGGSGLLLWFPRLFALLVPGWFFNLALLIHGEEALLAVGFIFTVHFFNSHIRPSKFPMDMVIFTGSVAEDEMRHERPEEIEQAEQEGRLEDLAVAAPSYRTLVVGRAVGSVAIVLGLTMVGLIAYALTR